MTATVTVVVPGCADGLAPNVIVTVPGGATVRGAHLAASE
jgi:hypothetical protein